MSCSRQKQGAGKGMFEKWSRDYHASTQQIWVSPVCHPGGMQWSWGIPDEVERLGRAYFRPGLGGHIQSLSLRVMRKLLWSLFFLKAGESHVEICRVPWLQSMHSADWKAARAPPARTSQEEAFASSLEKRWWQLGLRGTDRDGEKWMDSRPS